MTTHHYRNHTSRASASERTTTAERLAKICGLFSSTHDGERTAAAAKADALLRALGLTWRDVISVPPPARPLQPESTVWECQARYCVERAAYLDERERAFVEAMLRWHGEPSVKQQQWLDAIHARLRESARS